MTKFTTTLLALALTSASAFAQDYLNCGLSLRDNNPDCPFIGKCPQESLKKSKHQLFLELNEGDVKEGRIEFNSVIVLNSDDKEKKDVRITIFGPDTRPNQLKKEKNLKFISYKSKSFIDYSVQKYGSKISIDLKSAIYALNIQIEGDSKVQSHLFTESNMVNVVCEKLNKEVYEEFKAKKNAFEKFKKEKNAAKAGATKQ